MTRQQFKTHTSLSRGACMVVHTSCLLTPAYLSFAAGVACQWAESGSLPGHLDSTLSGNLLTL